MAKTDNTSPDRPVQIGVLAFEGCSAWITAGLLELFAIANVAASHARLRRAAAQPCFRCEVIAPSPRAVRASHGVRFAVAPLRRRYDAVIAPPIWGESPHDIQRRLRELRKVHPFLNRLAVRSDVMASSCSGAALLADAGLLSNYRATTCWWLAPWFKRQFPDVELAPDRLVMIDRNRWTAAAGSAYIHLGLALVRRFAGPQTADAAARLMLVERRRGSQSPFMTPVDGAAKTDDAAVRRAAKYLQEHANQQVLLRQVCRELAINERTLVRRFHAALGMTPLTYLQSQRIGRAKELLQRTSLPLDSIVAECGYEDISSFRKLFSRHVGMTPREYRSRFSSAS